MNDHEPQGAKLAILLAAGELFADFGIDATSVRTIAEKAKVNIAAINYYFGSKENLHTEVLRYVMTETKGARPEEFIEDPRLKTPEGAAHILRDMIYTWIKSFYFSDQPAWCGRVIIRSFLKPTPSLYEVIDQLFLPDHESLKRVFHVACPHLSDLQARLWAFSIIGQISFFEFCRIPVLRLLKRDEYEPCFLLEAAEHIAQNAIRALGLPEPSNSLIS